MQKTTRIKLIVFGVLISLIFAKPSYAYLDPGTGSYVFQILIAGLLGATLFIKDITKKVKKIFKIFFSKRATVEADEDQ